MQAFADGKKIEFRPRLDRAWSELAGVPLWNWGDCDYRVAEDPLNVALRIYSNGAWPGFTPNRWSDSNRDAIKKGLEAVINAVKAGEI